MYPTWAWSEYWFCILVVYLDFCRSAFCVQIETLYLFWKFFFPQDILTHVIAIQEVSI